MTDDYLRTVVKWAKHWVSNGYIYLSEMQSNVKKTGLSHFIRYFFIIEVHYRWDVNQRLVKARGVVYFYTRFNYCSPPS